MRLRVALASALPSRSWPASPLMTAAAVAVACLRTPYRTAATSQSPSFATEAMVTAAATARQPSPAATAADEETTHQESTSIPYGRRTFTYRPRWKYMSFFREKDMSSFMTARDESHVVSIAQTYRHPSDITVTLIPLRHFAHPLFFKQVDDLCCQHESVLMEGRVPLTAAPYSTFVPARTRMTTVRPPDHEDDEGWEPRAVEEFFQPFSWGVADSPNFTVVHAADKYDYEKLPWWCSLRFNVPVLGSLAREQHCLNMIFPLRESGYKSFAIPWGAGHMPIFHEMLLDNGFEPVGMCSLLVFSRIDGDVSEGEFVKMSRWQRRRARRTSFLYGVGGLMVAHFLWQSVRVEYRNRSGSGNRE